MVKKIRDKFMKKKELLPQSILKKLKSAYEHVPEREKVENSDAEFDSGLKEFLSAYGSDLSLEAGETLFFQGDSADGLYWIES